MQQTLLVTLLRIFSFIFFVGLSISVPTTLKAQCVYPDTIKPHARCKNITVYLDSTGNVGISPLDIDNFSYDNCPEIIIQISHSCFTCADIGNKTTTLFVKDPSGNLSKCDAVVTVKDTVKPKLTLKNVSNFYLDATGNKTVAFSDLATVRENCDSFKRIIGLRRSSTSTVFPTTSTISFSCVDTGFQKLDVFAKDSSGNIISKSITIRLRDTFGICSPKPIVNVAIAGTIKNALGVAVEAKTTLNNNSTNTQQTQIGSIFNFANLTPSQNFTVVVSRDSDWYNGVTTYDIALLSKHVLGIQSFSSPYSLIAADVNRDGSVDALDLLLMRRLVLRLDNHFEGNTSWRFIPQAVPVLSSTNFPLGQFAESLNYAPVTSNVTNANFMAVKVGDVDHSAQPTLNVMGNAVSKN